MGVKKRRKEGRKVGRGLKGGEEEEMGRGMEIKEGGDDDR